MLHLFTHEERPTMHMKKKRHITLMEIIIVMFLIALITGVIVLNYQGTLEEGKAFKTKAAIERVETILNLRAAEEPGITERLDSDWDKYIIDSPLVKNPNDFIRDGWGKKFDVEVKDGIIRVNSTNYQDYLKKKSESR